MMQRHFICSHSSLYDLENQRIVLSERQGIGVLNDVVLAEYYIIKPQQCSPGLVSRRA